MSIPILSLTSQKFAETLAAKLGRGSVIATLLYKSWYRKGRIAREHPSFRNTEDLLNKLSELTDFSLPEVAHLYEEAGTKKAILKLIDQKEIEMVAIPMRGRTTLCISSQVGCRMGCLFCRTAKMNLVRHLKVEEIVAQVFIARHLFNCNPSNIVFMGMGEPFDNYDNVKNAIEILMDPMGFGFGPSRITVSTSGLVEGIYRFMNEMDPALNLAISISGGTEAVRESLMPINQRHPMKELREAMVAYTAHPRRRIFIEYVLIGGKNDSQDEAQALGEYLRDLPVTINLIPYNPIGSLNWEASKETQIEAFRAVLRKLGFRVFIRQTHGQKIMAACGQLGKPKSLSSKSQVLNVIT